MSYNNEDKDHFFLIKMRKKIIEKVPIHDLSDSDRINIKRFGKNHYIIDEIRIGKWFG